MLARLITIPLFVLLMGAGSLAMLAPAFHAWDRADYATARLFLYGFILCGALTLVVGLATQGYRPRSVARSHLLTLLAAFALLPLLLALPLWYAIPRAGLIEVWFEMVSSFTTTGATLWDNPARLNPSLHLWRALVGWLGGFLVWVMAVAVLAPMNLGGFEVYTAGTPGQGVRLTGQLARIINPSERLARYAFRLLPVYAGLTVVLWVGLRLAGDSAVIALIHAMSVLSSSGISAIAGPREAASGYLGEAIIFVFFIFALSRLTFSRRLISDDRRPLWQDPEIKLAMVILGLVIGLLFLRHFLATDIRAATGGLRGALQALWGTLFTALSFMTTTGFESRAWLGATDWAGLQTPGLILVGLSIVGGGVATTAGGVKLLRLYALFRHAEREVERLIHPASVGGSGTDARRLRRQGAVMAWIFFILFTVTIIVVMGLLSLTGVQFEDAMVISVAALSNTGPLALVAAESPVSYAGIPDGAKIILAAAMIVGRLEALALIALMNPEFWRR